MVYSERYKAFSGDKKRFFSNVSSPEEAEARANDKNYRFLANNRLLIEQEFNTLFTSLKNEGNDRPEFWLYCYYCCVMLQNYYAAYGSQDKVNEYRQQSEKLLIARDMGRIPDDEVDSLQKKIAADLCTLASTPKHIVKLRDWLAFTNIYRIHFNFLRITLKQSVLVANELQWLEKLDQILGRHTNVESVVSRLNAPSPIFNLLSVGLFAARFIVNAGLLLKHTLLPSEKERSLGMRARFYHELYMSHCTMLNDAVWGTVNLLTNYPSLFNLSAPVANWMTAGFLVFDASLLLYRRHLAEREYLFKKSEFLSEKRNLETLMLGASLNTEDSAAYQMRCKILDEQLAQHEINWKTTSATFLFNVAAATFFMAGFTASLLMATPAAVVACYIVCNVAIAMYLSADIYGKYKEKTLVLQQNELENRDTSAAMLEMQTARNNFILAMAKNIIIPMLIVTTFAICWEAALILTAVYVGYECTRGYFNRKEEPKNDKVKELVASESDNDEDIEDEDSSSTCCLGSRA